MLLRVVMVLVCGCCPRHADRECCAVLAMLLLVVMVLVCWCCPRHADHECCAVWAMLRRCSPPHSTHSTPPPPNSAKGWCLPVPTHNAHPPGPTPCILDQAAPHIPTHRAHRIHGGPAPWCTPPLETHVRRTSPLQNCGGKDGAASSLMGSVEGRQLRRQLSRTHGTSQYTMVHLADSSKKDAKQYGTWYSTW
jgi:hypothetical protein